MADLFPALPLLPADPLHAICEAFEEAWATGSQPSIEAYLSLVELDRREQVLCELLRIEREQQDRRGAAWEVDFYRDRFPEFAHLFDSELQTAPHISGPCLPENVPAQVGRFEILGTLGSGTYGIVYAARDPQLERIVAVKVPRDSSDADARQQFLREARSAATLRHPNICPIFEVGEAEGRPYTVMACIEGRSLASELKQSGRWQAAAAARLVRDLALALVAAHDKGIVHRDLKPANILLDEHCSPIITDFGLATDYRRTAGEAIEHWHFLGTPAYMAPEQFTTQGSTAPAVDVYSLGVILYELLSGGRPFRGPARAMIQQIAGGPAEALAELAKLVDRRIHSICSRAMAHAADQRFASMSDFAAVLDDYLARVLQANAAPQPRLRYVAWLGVAASFLAMAGVWSGLPSFDKRETAQAESNSALLPKLAEADPERAVAMWLLQRGAILEIEHGETARHVQAAGSLPTDDVQILEIDLDECAPLTPGDFRRLAPLTRLTSLTCPPATDDQGLIELAQLKQLDSVSLDDAHVSEEGLRHLTGMSNLSALSLKRIGMHGDGLRHLQKLTALRRLSVSGNPLQPDAFQRLANMTQLEVLRLDHTPLDDNGLEHLSQIASLVTLEVGDTQIHGGGLWHLRPLKCLERLRLDRIPLTNDELRFVSELTCLRYLVLDGTQVNGEGLEHLKALPHLKALSLNYVKIGRNGLAALADMPSLTELSLYGGPVSDSAVESLGRMKQLQRLNVGHTRLSLPAIDHLQQLVPNCQLQR